MHPQGNNLNQEKAEVLKSLKSTIYSDLQPEKT
jgi:hypothetical protein